METVGQRHTRPAHAKSDNHVFEDGEWWFCIGDNGRRRTSALQARQKARMYVNGKYIPKTHPLHKAGRYKGFEEAAFSSLANYDMSLEGQVYIITNPAWEGWVKVGMAIDTQDRAGQYQTSSPFRDYTVEHMVTTVDRRKLESMAHALLGDTFEQRNEWFKCSVEIAKRYIDSAVGDMDE